MRLIDADNLKDKLYEFNSYPWSFKMSDYEMSCFIDAMPTINPMKWISAKDEMPEKKEEVIIFLYGCYYIGYWDEDETVGVCWHFDDFSLYGDEVNDVDAWMRFPKAEWGTLNAPY